MKVMCVFDLLVKLYASFSRDKDTEKDCAVETPTVMKIGEAVETRTVMKIGEAVETPTGMKIGEAVEMRTVMKIGEAHLFLS